MLEKIGLPPKPSLKGNDWVLDASHCQGCQSQFTLFNRKHHCRRCGGLFCNNCTLHRMKLRGQGDPPVRICEPCKRIEEESRFDRRRRHKTRKGGSSKVEAKNEDELLQDLIEDGKHSLKSTSVVHDLQVPGTPDMKGDIVSSDGLDEVGSSSPEELHKLAQEEKNRYKTLKSQGKSKAALVAFKRGKELERQAEALETALRRGHRMASTQKASKTTEDNKLLTLENEKPSTTSKSRKDDLASELRELGWTDDDLHEVGKKADKQNLERELSSLLGETHSEKKGGGIDKTQVIARKKKALQLKREGKLAEAKEELKQAKILEKQLEEQELLAEGEESEDEISALIRSMENDKQDLSFDDVPGHSLNFDLTRLAEDAALMGNLDVTDDDMNDPEMAGMLRSFGWSEEDAPLDEDSSEIASGKSYEKLAAEVLALKREALKQKKAGNLDMARDILKKAKLLEKDLESLQTAAQDTDPACMQKTSISQFPKKLFPTDINDNAARTSSSTLKQPLKSRSVIQKELLALKRKALALKREGRLDEAEEELTKGKVLELQLEEMEKVPIPLSDKELGRKTVQAAHPHQGAFMTFDVDEGADPDVTDQDLKDPALLSALTNLGWKEESKAVDGAMKTSESAPSKPNTISKNSQSNYPHHNAFMTSDLAEGDNVEVTDQDMEDPALLSVLKNMGWKEHSEAVNRVTKTSDSAPGQCKSNFTPDTLSLKPIRSKGEIQRELLTIKRKALALRRQGKAEEAEEEQRKAGDLEKQLKELEAKHQTYQFGSESLSIENEIPRGGTEVKNQPNHFEKRNYGTGSSLHPESSKIGNETPKGRGDQDDHMPSMPINLYALHKDGSADTVGDPEKLKYLVEPPMSDVAVEIKLSHSQNLANTFDLLTGDHGSSGMVAVPLSGQNLNLVGFDEQNELPFLPNKLDEDSHPCDPTLDDAKPLNTVHDKKIMDHSLEHDSIHHCSPNMVCAHGKGNETPIIKETPGNNAPLALDSLEDQILAHKRRALGLKREGKLAQAREELKQAKLLERTLEGDTKQADEDNQKAYHLMSADTKQANKDNQRADALTSSDIPFAQKVTQVGSVPAQKQISSRDRFKLQQECLSKKRQAMKLRREGKVDEAESLLAEAQNLQAQMEELDSSMANVTGSRVEADASVEDFLDPQLFLALKSVGIGVENPDSLGQPPKKPEVNTGPSNKDPKVIASKIQGKAPASNASTEKAKIEEQVKTEKIRAVNFKRAGKQAEALEALRSAKLLEKKLASLG